MSEEVKLAAKVNEIKANLHNIQEFDLEVGKTKDFNFLVKNTVDVIGSLQAQHDQNFNKQSASADALSQKLSESGLFDEHRQIADLFNFIKAAYDSINESSDLSAVTANIYKAGYLKMLNLVYRLAEKDTEYKRLELEQTGKKQLFDKMIAFLEKEIARYSNKTEQILNDFERTRKELYSAIEKLEVRMTNIEDGEYDEDEAGSVVPTKSKLPPIPTPPPKPKEEEEEPEPEEEEEEESQTIPLEETPRQEEAFKLAQQGKTPRQAAEIMGITVQAAQKHLDKACKKKGVYVKFAPGYTFWGKK